MVRNTADRDFKGVWIPKEVWLDNRLSMLDKGILTEIDSLDMSEAGCFASNEYLAEFCQCSERKVSESVSKLIQLGYLQMVSFDGRKRVLRSRVEKTAMQSSKNCEAESQNLQHINTSNNPATKTDNSISSIDEIMDGFVAFWKVYPRKDGKSDAIRAWKSLKPNEELQQTILADINRRMSINGTWYNTDRQFIKMPASYLRGRRWEDEAATGKAQQQPNYDSMIDPWTGRLIE